MIIYHMTKENVLEALSKRFRNLPENAHVLRAIGRDGKQLYRLYYEEIFIGCEKSVVIEISGDFFGAFMQEFLNESNEFDKLLISLDPKREEMYKCSFKNN